MKKIMFAFIAALFVSSAAAQDDFDLPFVAVNVTATRSFNKIYGKSEFEAFIKRFPNTYSFFNKNGFRLIRKTDAEKATEKAFRETLYKYDGPGPRYGLGQPTPVKGKKLAIKDSDIEDFYYASKDRIECQVRMREFYKGDDGKNYLKVITDCHISKTLEYRDGEEWKNEIFKISFANPTVFGYKKGDYTNLIEKKLELKSILPFDNGFGLYAEFHFVWPDA